DRHGYLSSEKRCWSVVTSYIWSSLPDTWGGVIYTLKKADRCVLEKEYVKLMFSRIFHHH
nr:hypothetical protein [Tanacetum cinerariifolium]